MFVASTLLSRSLSSRTECKDQVLPKMGSWKKRLPTIAEDGDDLVAAAEVQPNLPAGLPESLTDPLSIISNTEHAAVVAQKLQDGNRTDRKQLLAWLLVPGLLKALPAMVLSEAGSKVVQVALDISTGTDRMTIVSALHGSVLDLCASRHGHEVLVVLIRIMPAASIVFVADEIRGHCVEIARDRFGSSVLDAMTMHCSEAQIASLATEIKDEALALSRHPHGSCIIEKLLEYATSECGADISRRLMPDASRLAMRRQGSGVVEKVFRYCDDTEQQAMARAFLQADAPCAVVDVACSRCGSSVLEEIAKSQVFTIEFQSQLATALPRLRKSKYGRRALEHFGMKSQIDIGA